MCLGTLRFSWLWAAANAPQVPAGRTLTQSTGLEWRSGSGRPLGRGSGVGLPHIALRVWFRKAASSRWVEMGIAAIWNARVDTTTRR